MKFFDRFDKVFCINLDRRPDRMENFINQVNKFDLGDFERISAVDGDLLIQHNHLLKGEVGILKTVINIIKHSIEKKYENILIIEDDCSFTEEIIVIQDYFDLLPSDWHMLYMGGNHNIHIGIDPPKKINEKVMKLHHTYSAHFIAIKSILFNEILDISIEFKEPIDVIYSNLQKKYNAYSFYPAIAKQLAGHSDIQKTIVNYDWLIK